MLGRLPPGPLSIAARTLWVHENQDTHQAWVAGPKAASIATRTLWTSSGHPPRLGGRTQ